MANVNRSSPSAPSRGEYGSNVPIVTRRGTVPIRRNVEDFDDPYIPDESVSGTAICKQCHAVHHADRWSLDAAIYQEALRTEGVRHVLCPACHKVHDRQPGGIVTLTSDFIGEHKEEILNLLRNEDVRARNVNPLERIMEIQGDGNQLVVTTTNEKLAQRIGRAMHRAYNGDVEYQWVSDSKQARVNWTR